MIDTDAVNGILPAVTLTAQGEALDSEVRILFYAAATRAKKISLPVCLKQEKIWLTHFV